MTGILYAMGRELAPPFSAAVPLPTQGGLELYRAGEDLVLCVCGIGKVNAAMGAQLLIHRFGVTSLWNAGVAGCFTDWEAGTLLAARACVQHDMEVFGDPPGLISPLDLVELPCAGGESMARRLNTAGLPCEVGVVATGDWFHRDLPRARRIRDTFHAHVCDMEAGAAAQVCLRNAVPFHCLKVVSDHLFHPAQHREYEDNLPRVTGVLNRALALLLQGE